jgi:hypothetical protein
VRTPRRAAESAALAPGHAVWLLIRAADLVPSG